MKRRLASGVPPVWIPAHLVEKRPDEMLHSMSGGVVQRRVVKMLISVAVVRIQGTPELVGTLIHLHGRVLVSVEQILFEFG